MNAVRRFDTDPRDAQIAQLTERNERLEEEISYLKGMLGLQAREEDAQKLHRAWGLTGKEAQALLHIYSLKGATATKESVMLALYQESADTPEIKIVDVFVCKIRKKLPEGVIDTLWGAGYAVTADGIKAVREVLETPLPDVRRFAPYVRQRIKTEPLAISILRYLVAGTNEAPDIARAMRSATNRVHSNMRRLKDDGWVVLADYRPRGGLGVGGGAARGIYEATPAGRRALAEYDARVSGK